MRNSISNTVVMSLEWAERVGHDIDVIIRAVENDTFARRNVTRSVSEGLGFALRIVARSVSERLGFAALADASG